jgi:hypothetical protein
LIIGEHFVIIQAIYLFFHLPVHCRLLLPLPFSAAPHSPALKTLSKYGRAVKMAGGHWGNREAWLCWAFGAARQQDLPVAPYAFFGEGGSPGANYWLRADPVSVQLARSRLILLAGNAVSLSAEEAAQFVAALNAHFAPQGWHFAAPHPQRWYLRLPVRPDLCTTPLAAANGRDIRDLLPAGADGAYWRRQLNEAQVLLHNHPLNETREADGKLAVNSFWPWGGGTLRENLQAPCTRLFADDPLARGLAMAANLPATPLPAALPQDMAGCGASPLFALEAAHDDPRACLDEWEKNWFAPALAALRRGAFRRLSLLAPGEDAPLEITLNRSDLWKFWRHGALPVSR